MSDAHVSPVDPLIGAAVGGRYVVNRQLGKGSMGAVYEAEHSGTGRRVALKILLDKGSAAGETARARFDREARAAGKLESQHIAQVLDNGVDAATARPFLVMELLHGEDLSALLARLGSLPVDTALRIVAQALRGVEAAHQVGIVHRDIKPANLFLVEMEEGERRVKLLDFGIAKVVEPITLHAQALTSTGSLLGSPLYMSPEQVRRRGQIDRRSDIWSMGVVLYQMLSGHVPHGDASSFGALVMAICAEPAPPLLDIAPWVPAEVAAIVEQALAIDREQRFPTARAMLGAVERLLPGGHALDASMLVPLPAAADAPVAAAPRGFGATVRMHDDPNTPARGLHGR